MVPEPEVLIKVPNHISQLLLRRQARALKGEAGRKGGCCCQQAGILGAVTVAKRISQASTSDMRFATLAVPKIPAWLPDCHHKVREILQSVTL